MYRHRIELTTARHEDPEGQYCIVLPGVISSVASGQKARIHIKKKFIKKCMNRALITSSIELDQCLKKPHGNEPLSQ